jgi:hypothetical protein
VTIREPVNLEIVEFAQSVIQIQIFVTISVKKTIVKFARKKAVRYVACPVKSVVEKEDARIHVLIVPLVNQVLTLMMKVL